MSSYVEIPHGDHVTPPPNIPPAVRESHQHPLAPSAPHLRHVWIITGPAGCGKSTVAQFVADACQLPYLEGDDFHPPANIEKMSAGHPLTDDDRWEWLQTLRDRAVAEAEGPAKGCVVTCSCLKKKYRDIIRGAAQGRENELRVRFVYLAASEDTLLDRVRSRKGHYMKDDMVHSQFAALEEPDASETDVITVDCTPEQNIVMHTALDKVKSRMAEDEA